MGRSIGIITFHRAINYGAVLQSYGLWAALKGLGADARLIDYRNEHIETSYRLTWGLKKTYSGIRKWAPTVPYRQSKTMRFREFLENEVALTPACTRGDVAAVAEGFDAVVTGSDQVFNPSLFGRDPAYFCDFAKPPTRIYSYAASLGNFRFDADADIAFVALLDRFERISVRESSSVPTVSAITDIPVRVDADPTLLLGKDAWNTLLPAERIRERPYIFCYSVHPFKSGLGHAKEIARETGLDLVFLHNRIKEAGSSDEDGTVLLHDSSPYDWLRLIRDAECVVTNSFHGSVFCTVFGTRFLAEVDTRGGFNNRIWRLLGDTGLQSRILERCNLDSVSPAELALSEIDWSQAAEVIAGRRAQSLDYLSQICSGDREASCR